MDSAGPSLEAQAPLTASEKRKTEKELLEARKAGTIPAELDEDGKEINPHIPLYMANAPWYLGDSKPGLKHQRSQFHREYDKLGTWYARGQRAGPAPTKFRKGACENCGAMTHKTKDCVERPRKTGAKFTGKDLQADEVIVECNLAYDGKRDRWNGYDPATHAKYLAEFELQEAERKAVKAQELEQAIKAGTAPTDAAGKDEDLEQDAIVESEEKKLARGAGCEDVRTRTTIRNLRIREDTAKYLLNLDLNSAHYDPKTRSMRGNPHGEGELEDKVYLGDNALRQSGAALDVVQMQVFCWDANDKGTEVHLQAAPSHAEKLYANFKAKKEILKQETKRKLLERYGGEEHLQPAPRELVFGQTEAFVQYSRDGKLLKGVEKAVPRSKYEEDVFHNNHTSVWGSYWEAGKWGYRPECCRQFCRNSYCLGAAALKAQGAPLRLEGEAQEKEKDFEQAKEDVQKELERRQLLERMRQLNEAMLHNEEDTNRKADEEEKERQLRKRERDELAAMDEQPDDRRRKYNSGRADYEVTEEELEEFRRTAVHEADPMRQFLQNG